MKRVLLSVIPMGLLCFVSVFGLAAYTSKTLPPPIPGTEGDIGRPFHFVHQSDVDRTKPHWFDYYHAIENHSDKYLLTAKWDKAGVAGYRISPGKAVENPFPSRCNFAVDSSDIHFGETLTNMKAAKVYTEVADATTAIEPTVDERLESRISADIDNGKINFSFQFSTWFDADKRIHYEASLGEGTTLGEIGFTIEELTAVFDNSKPSEIWRVLAEKGAIEDYKYTKLYSITAKDDRRCLVNASDGVTFKTLKVVLFSVGDLPTPLASGRVAAYLPQAKQ